MNRKKQAYIPLLLTGLIALSPLTSITCYATTPAPDEPLAIHYDLERLEDELEKKHDKKYKVDWDFKLVYHDQKVTIIMEYLKKSKKHLEKISDEELHDYLKMIVDKVYKTLKTEPEIDGIIIEDDTQKSTHIFQYKNGNLDIK